MSSTVHFSFAQPHEGIYVRLLAFYELAQQFPKDSKHGLLVPVLERARLPWETRDEAKARLQSAHVWARAETWQQKPDVWTNRRIYRVDGPCPLFIVRTITYVDPPVLLKVLLSQGLAAETLPEGVAHDPWSSWGSYFPGTSTYSTSPLIMSLIP